MSNKKQLVLQWEDFNLNASKVFKNLRIESDFFDVTLGCSDSNGQLLQAHKVILASLSSVFKSLKQHGANQVTNNTVLFLRGIPYKDLSAILDFIYQGEVSIFEADLDSFLSAADDLKIDGLSSKTFFGEQSMGQLTKPVETFEHLFNNGVEFQPIPESVYSDGKKVSVKQEDQSNIEKGVTKMEDVTLEKFVASSLSNEAAQLSKSAENSIGVIDLKPQKNEKSPKIWNKKIRREKAEVNHILLKVASLHKSKKANMSDGNLTVERNKKGGFNAIKDGHIYHINVRNSKTLGWQCMKRKVLNCKASVLTDMEVTKLIRSSPHTHNHSPIRNQFQEQI